MWTRLNSVNFPQASPSLRQQHRCARRRAGAREEASGRHRGHQPKRLQHGDDVGRRQRTPQGDGCRRAGDLHRQKQDATEVSPAETETAGEKRTILI